MDLISACITDASPMASGSRTSSWMDSRGLTTTVSDQRSWSCGRLGPTKGMRDTGPGGCGAGGSRPMMSADRCPDAVASDRHLPNQASERPGGSTLSRIRRAHSGRSRSPSLSARRYWQTWARTANPATRDVRSEFTGGAGSGNHSSDWIGPWQPLSLVCPGRRTGNQGISGAWADHRSRAISDRMRWQQDRSARGWQWGPGGTRPFGATDQTGLTPARCLGKAARLEMPPCPPRAD